jgi:hypothetical protein
MNIMKKIFIPLALIFALTISVWAHAAMIPYPYDNSADVGPNAAAPTTGTVTTTPAQQSQQYDCSSIDSYSEYQNCCTDTGGGSSADCVNYEDQYLGSTSNTAPGQIGTGTTPTSAPLSTAAVNGNGNSSNFSGNVPQAITNQAQSCNAIQFNNLLNIAIWAKCVIGAIIIPGIFTLAFAVFLWGVFKFVRASDKADKDDSKQFIYMGLIGLFVMTSVWGIISMTFGFGTVVPTLQTNYLSNGTSTTTTTPNATAPTTGTVTTTPS